jgi:hypothetical protein
VADIAGGFGVRQAGATQRYCSFTCIDQSVECGRDNTGSS